MYQSNLKGYCDTRVTNLTHMLFKREVSMRKQVKVNLL